MNDLLVNPAALACVFVFGAFWFLLCGFVVGGMFVRRRADKEIEAAHSQIPRAFAEGRDQGLRDAMPKRDDHGRFRAE